MIHLPYVAEEFAKLVHAAIEKHTKHLSEGKADSMEDYKRRCGEIAGLRRALDIYGEILKAHVEQAHDDDEDY